MLYLMIGLVLVVAVGAIFQRSRQRGQGAEEDGTAPLTAESAPPEDALLLSRPAGETPDSAGTVSSGTLPATTAPSVTVLSTTVPPGAVTDAAKTPEAAEGGAFSIEEDVTPVKPVLAAAPISSPGASLSATYSSSVPNSVASDSPYAFGSTEEAKAKPDAALLRWSGKAGSLQIGDLTLHGPMAYWSDGPSSTPEPSCIDITLPVQYPEGDHELPTEGAASYREMTPLQRGTYLLWLAGGRIQPPSHVCYPILWLFGLERRVLADRLDISLCVGEAFRLLPLIRWDSLRTSLIKFITWMVAKAWLPEDHLLAFARGQPSMPLEILDILLRPYADAHLPLPSVVAFTVMRTSVLGEGEDLPRIPHTDELVANFSPKYKSKCSGGIVLSKPKISVFVAYYPTNPTLADDKNVGGGVLELPDFFKDTTDFAPLVAVWKDFAKGAFPQPAVPLTAAEELEERPDWNSFMRRLQGLPPETEEEGTSEENEITSPLVTTLSSMAELMEIEQGKKPAAADRKKIVDVARVEGFLILPDLGIAGKEYQWDEPVALAPFPAGSRPSQDYSAAAFLLEYSLALTGTAAQQAPDSAASENLRERLNDYFSLSSDDHARLESLSSVLLTPRAESPDTRTDPANLGECLQFWLQRDQRAAIRDFLARFLTRPRPGEEGEGGTRNPAPAAAERNENLIRVICSSLDVGREGLSALTPLTAEASLELGVQVGAVLAPLFKD